MPVHVYWQMQTQLLVSGAELAHLYVYDGTSGILLEQRPEASAWDTLRQDWDRFMDLVRTDQPPPLTERDTIIRTDPEWLAAAREYIAAKKLADDTAVELDALKQRLIEPRPAQQRTGRWRVGVAVLEDRRGRLQEGAGAGGRRS